MCDLKSLYLFIFGSSLNHLNWRTWYWTPVALPIVWSVCSFLFSIIVWGLMQRMSVKIRSVHFTNCKKNTILYDEKWKNCDHHSSTIEGNHGPQTWHTIPHAEFHTIWQESGLTAARSQLRQWCEDNRYFIHRLHILYEVGSDLWKYG